jgi:hypothetical protein
VKALAVVLGFLIAAIVMGIIVFLIFRIYGFYLGTINEAANMKLR